MSQKSDEIRSINGAFTFKGESKENVYAVAEEFFDWCKRMEKEYEVTLISNRADYNGYWKIDRTSIDKKD